MAVPADLEHDHNKQQQLEQHSPTPPTPTPPPPPPPPTPPPPPPTTTTQPPTTPPPTQTTPTAPPSPTSDGSIKLLVYWTPTSTDQYLHFPSHHLLNYKLEVVRTLLDRCNNVVTEPEDKIREEQHITTALKKCGYPKDQEQAGDKRVEKNPRQIEDQWQRSDTIRQRNIGDHTTDIQETPNLDQNETTPSGTKTDFPSTILAKIADRDSNKRVRQVKKAIQIRKQGPAMNRHFVRGSNSHITNVTSDQAGRMSAKLSWYKEHT
ncbi:proteoglycan 4-like [Mizuhopecten yessoensis]|uniref:proteoglycan 4-like n=1 Tax=Mizuhopecten yessoensis TaxID=6573 RepID=UPI000B45BCA2|nr:proteoglycan 4-like [Mizuhopecten yessoensis]